MSTPETYVVCRTPARPDLPDDQRWLAAGDGGRSARGATPVAALARLCRESLPTALQTPREPGLNPDALPDLYAACQDLLLQVAAESHYKLWNVPPAVMWRMREAIAKAEANRMFVSG